MNHSNQSTQNGQSLVEYVALTALVAVVSVGTVKTFGGKVRTRLNQITTTFDRNIQQGLKVKKATEAPEAAEGEDGDESPIPGLRVPSPLKIPGLIRLPAGFGR